MAIRDLDLERDLNEHLQESETEAVFTIDDDRKADWALRTIRECEARVEQVKAFAEERKREIDTWAEQATARETQSIAYLTGLLESYHRILFADNPRLKTIKLPAGELQLRKAQPQFARDNDKLTEWLDAHRPEFVKIQKSPDWAQAKKAFEITGRHLVDPTTGAIVDGVEVHEPEQEAFRVKTNREGS